MPKLKELEKKLKNHKRDIELVRTQISKLRFDGRAWCVDREVIKRKSKYISKRKSEILMLKYQIALLKKQS